MRPVVRDWGYAWGAGRAALGDKFPRACRRRWRRSRSKNFWCSFPNSHFLCACVENASPRLSDQSLKSEKKDPGFRQEKVGAPGVRCVTTPTLRRGNKHQPSTCEHGRLGWRAKRRIPSGRRRRRRRRLGRRRRLSARWRWRLLRRVLGQGGRSLGRGQRPPRRLAVPRRVRERLRVEDELLQMRHAQTRERGNRQRRPGTTRAPTTARSIGRSEAKKM